MKIVILLKNQIAFLVFCKNFRHKTRYFSESLFFRMISVATCSRDTFPLGMVCDKIICSKIIPNYLMFTNNRKQSKTKKAFLLTFSFIKLLRIAVFNFKNPYGNNSEINYNSSIMRRPYPR